MENGKIKVTTTKQFEKLFQLMENNPEAAHGKPQFGCSKNMSKELWEKFSKELNSLGPPTRTAHEWALEESVAQLIQIRKQVAPAGNCFGSFVAEDVVSVVDDTIFEASSTAYEAQVANFEDRPTSASPAIKNHRRRNNLETERLQLLNMQAQTQKKIEQLEKSVYKNYEINKKLLQIKKQKFNIYERQARERSELNALKVEVQKLKIAKMKGFLEDGVKSS